MTELWELRVRLLLSIQRAMLGEVTPNIRAVTASVDECIITLRWIIDGEITDDLKNDLSAVGAEVVADFETHQIAEEFIRSDAPRPMDDLSLGQLAYMRKEETTPAVTPPEEPGPMGHCRDADEPYGSRLAPLRGLAGMTGGITALRASRGTLSRTCPIR